jgi:hypothetical protein
MGTGSPLDKKLNLICALPASRSQTPVLREKGSTEIRDFAAVRFVMRITRK